MVDVLKKTIKIGLILTISGVFIGHAGEARPFRQLFSIDSLRNQFRRSNLKFQDQGLLFGHFSIQSCMFADADLMVINNYCFPKKKYVAEAYTFISRERGIIEFYREDDGALVVREITQKVFASLLARYLSEDYRTYSFAELNPILEKINDLYEPGCWSTNWDYELEAPKAACNVSDVGGFKEWSNETLTYVQNEKNWEVWLEEIRGRLSEITP